MREEHVALRHGDQRAGEQLAEQEVPARQRAHEQHAHAAHLAVVDHGERALQAGEQEDHAEQARRDVHLVQDVGLIRRLDRHAEHRAEPGGEDEQPHQRPHQSRDEAAALVHEAQRLARDDHPRPAQVVAEGEAGRTSRQGVVEAGYAHAARASAVSLVNAWRRSGASALAQIAAPSPSARIRPRCRTIT